MCIRDSNSPGQDWYESRGDLQTLLTLNTDNIGGNSTKKAALLNYGIARNAYLTQEFSPAQTGRFMVGFDIYIDRIENSGNYDRTGHVFIGNDSITGNAPTGTGAERFICLAFYDPTPCLLYTSDAADDLLCVDLGGRRIIKKTKL